MIKIDCSPGTLIDIVRYGLSSLIICVGGLPIDNFLAMVF